MGHGDLYPKNAGTKVFSIFYAALRYRLISLEQTPQALLVPQRSRLRPDSNTLTLPHVQQRRLPYARGHHRPVPHLCHKVLQEGEEALQEAIKEA